jgi:tetratricopeptide (TPR) repeat protein
MEVVLGTILVIFLIVLFAIVRGKLKKGKVKIPGFEGELEGHSKEDSSAPPSAQQQSHSPHAIQFRDINENKGTVTVGGTHYHGITLKEHEESLKRRESEILEEQKKVSAQDQERIQILELELSKVREKLDNSEQDLENTQKLLAETEKALERQPDLEPEQLENARAALETGNTENAEALFQQVLDTQKSNMDRAAEAAYQLGQLAENKIDYLKAVKYYERAAQLQPDNGEFLNQYGLILHTLGQYDQAIEYYEKALASDLETFGEAHPNVARLWNNLGLAWDSKGEYDQAIEYFEKALASFQKAGLAHNAEVVQGNIENLHREMGK